MKKEFIEFPSFTSFAEIFQSREIKFAFVTETDTTYTQQHGKVLCRDFLADVLHAEDQKKAFSIYNFKWNPEKEHIDRDATKLVMFFETPEQLKELKKNIHILNNLEISWTLRKTRILTVNEKTAIIIGSRFYLRKGFAISLYSYLLKSYSLAADFNDLTSNELSYYQTCGESFQKLLKNFRQVLAYKTNVSGVNTKYSDSIIHNYAGFVAVCTYPAYQSHAVFLQNL